MNAQMEDLVEVEGVEEVAMDEAADVMISVPTFTDGVKAKQKQGEQRPHPSLLSLDQSYSSNLSNFNQEVTWIRSKSLLFDQYF